MKFNGNGIKIAATVLLAMAGFILFALNDFRGDVAEAKADRVALVDAAREVHNATALRVNEHETRVTVLEDRWERIEKDLDAIKEAVIP